MVAFQLIDAVDPIDAGARLDLAVQLFQDELDVADDGYGGAHRLVDFGGVDVDVDDFGVGGEVLDAAHHAVVEPHPDADKDIGLVDGDVGVGHAVHAGHADGEDVGLGEAANAEQGRDDRNLRLLGQGLQFVVGLGDDDAVAGDDDGALGLANQLGGLLDLRRMPWHMRVVAGQLDGLGIAVLDFFLLHVLGNVDQHRSGPPRPRDVEGFLDRALEVGGVHDEIVVLGDRQGDAGDVGLLEGVLADGLPGHLAGDGDHGDRVHHGVGQTGDEVGGAGARGGPADADLAGGPRVAVGGVGGRLLVAYENVAESGVFGEGLVEREYRPAEQPEDGIDALFQESLADDLGSCAFHLFLLPAAIAFCQLRFCHTKKPVPA